MEIFALQDAGLIPKEASWAGVTLSYRGRYGDLVPISASYEEEGRYGLQTPFSRALSSNWVGSKWYADGLHSSLITVGNAGEEPARAELTLHYNRGKDKYVIEKKLQPGEQMWVDVAKTIRTQLPDKTGNAIPSTVEFGSYSIRNLDRTFGPTLFEGKVTIDKKFGHAAYGCGDCCDPSNPWMVPSLRSVSIGEFFSSEVWGCTSCGESCFSAGNSILGWESSNTSILSVDGWSGGAEGLAVGSANVIAELHVPGPYYEVGCPHDYVQVYGGVTVIDFGVGGPNHIFVGSDSNTVIANTFYAQDHTLSGPPNPTGGLFR